MGIRAPGDRQNNVKDNRTNEKSYFNVCKNKANLMPKNSRIEIFVYRKTLYPIILGGWTTYPCLFLSQNAQ
jgi:hypothetical protein